jgi:4-hydroxy-3-methylbut-2-en-1-yl diphosphate synthase IspG/GcpE
MDCKDIVSKSVSAWYENKAIEEIKERASNMKLDLEAVSGAQAALKEVTEMMKVGNDEEIVPGNVTKPVEPVRAISNTWQGLSEALDEDHKGYLEAALEGKAKQYLKDKGLLMTRIEEAINTLAMDSVGDSIVEDGNVFEDYADDVRSLL